MIIGLGGKKGFGKDFCAKYLIEKYGFKRVAFGDPLKYAVSQIFDFNDEQLFGSEKEDVDERWGFSPRWVFQTVGTELFRDLFGDLAVKKGYWKKEESKDIWVKSADRKIDNYISSGNHIVITDLRFKNELDMLQTKNNQTSVITVYIDNPDIESKETHSSETSLSLNNVDWDYHFINKGDKYIKFWKDLLNKHYFEK